MKRRVTILLAAALVALSLALFVACDETPSTTNCTATFSLGEATGVSPADITAVKDSNIVLPALDVAYEGHTFVGWLADSDGALHVAGDQFKLDKDVNFTAVWRANVTDSVYFDVFTNFDGTKGTLTLSPSTAGGTKYAQGSTVIVTPTPNADYYVASVSVSGDVLTPQEGVYSFTVTKDCMVSVTFAERLTISLDFDEQLGSASLSAPAGGATKYAGGESVTLSASGKQGASIVGDVLVDGVEVELTDGEYTFTVEHNSNIQISFLHLYSLTLQFDENKGNFQATTPSTHDGKYVEGEEVSVLATANVGFGLKAIKDGDDSVRFAAGTYTFTVDKDATLTAEFANSISQTLLASLQGSLLFEGVMTNRDLIEDGVITQDNLCLFDEAQQAVWQREIFDGELYFNAVYINNDGKIMAVSHDVAGKVEYYDSEEDYDDYDNPFKSLAPSAFIYDEDGSIVIPDLTLARDVARAITGFTENVSLFKMTESEGKITGLYIEIEPVVVDGEAILQYTYEYDISQHGAASVPEEWLKDYPGGTPALRALQTALLNAARATSYTIDFHSEESGSDALDYHIYVTPDAIYEDCPDWESGYVMRDDGNVWAFDYYPAVQSATFSGRVSGAKAVKDMAAPFIPKQLSGMSSAASINLLTCGSPQLTPDENGVTTFYVRQIDQLLQEYLQGYEGSFATAFAVGRDRQYMYVYAYDLLIRIKDGALYQVEFSYEFYGIKERVTMTFGAFNETEIPIEIVDRGMWPGYIGKYSGEDKDGKQYSFDITEDKVNLTIDGVQKTVGVIEFSDEEGFTLQIDGKTYYLYGLPPAPYTHLQFGDRDGKLTVVVVNENYEEEDNPPSGSQWDKFIGVFESDDGRYHIEITADSIAVTIDGNETIATSIIYDSVEGYFTFMLNGVEYTLQDMSYSDPVTVIMFYPSDNFEMNRLSRK